MSNNIGGFAAFAITAVVVGGALEITRLLSQKKTAVTTPKPSAFEKNKETLWAKMVELHQAGKSTEEIKTEVKGLYDSCIFSAPCADSIEAFKELVNLKYASL